MKCTIREPCQSKTIRARSILFSGTLLTLTLMPHAAASPEEAGLDSRTVRLVTGIEMHYVEKGNPKGPAVIFVPGYTDSWRSFERNLPFISSDFHVFVLDQRGHGDTSKPACCYGQADFAADVIAFMDARKIRKATLVGHSMGSFVAHKVAVEEPSRVERLVLIGGAATAAENEAVLALNDSVQNLQEPVDPVFVAQLHTRSFWSESDIPRSLVDTAVSESLKVPVAIWKQALAGLLHEDHSGELSRITAPTLIFWGDQDSMFPFGDQQQLHTLIPNSTLKLYLPETFPKSAGPGSTGQRLHAEWPQRFVADLEAFLRQPPRPAERSLEPSFDIAIEEQTGQQGTCSSTGCQACRDAGFTSAHDQCVSWIVGARYTYRVRYRYSGANEGHDGAANLLMRKGDGVNDVCNISKGTCCMADSGCFLGVGHCSGSGSARVCTASQSCAGQFGPGGPMADSGAVVPLGSARRLIGQYGGKPYDCDCTSGDEGRNGGFEVWVNASGSISSVGIWGPSEPATGAGNITTQGWAYEIQTYKAQTCGTFYDGLGCSGQTRRIRHTNLEYRNRSGGNPNFTVARSCGNLPSQCPPGRYCCEPGPGDSCELCVPNGSECP
jgi:pimeloyl-ACP methyl ester carboxylesterase